MRVKFPPEVEKGRERSGKWASEPGGLYGAFRVRCPFNNIVLTVLADDGSAWGELGLPGTPWEHVSVSLPTRTPTWEEMCWVKSLFWDDEECVVQFHPPRSAYVNNNGYTLHMWRQVGVDIPLPPRECV